MKSLSSVVSSVQRCALSLGPSATGTVLLVALGGCASAPGVPSNEASVVRNRNALLSEDPIRARALEQAVAGFLAQAITGDFTEEFVDPDALTRHGFFFDRVAGFGATPDLGVPSILKAYTLDGETYFVTVAFMGSTASEPVGAPFLDMIVELKATPHAGGYRFDSPFEERTRDFDATTIEDVRFRYSGAFDDERARQFLAIRSRLTRVSGVTPEPLEYFAFRSLDEMLKSYGLIFDEDRCNFLGHDLGRFDDDRRRYITGMGDECYMYGYASLFLRSADHDAGERYGTMAVGFKTLFGGYWLIGTPMEALTAELRETIRRQPDLDLLDLFRKGRNGQTQGHAPSLVMAAMVCERTLQECGFDGVLRLIYSGSSGERFFPELEDLLGVGEQEFHGAIVRWLKSRA